MLRWLPFCALGAFVGRGEAQYMSIDGTGHNLQNNAWNSASSSFLPRRVWYADGISAMHMPAGFNARNVSNTVCANGGISGAPYTQHGVSQLVAAFGQFVAHEVVWTTHSQWTGVSLTNNTADIPVPTCDTDMDATCTGTAYIHFVRNDVINGTGTSTTNPRRQMNSQTGWIDGSVIYGMSAERLVKLRTFHSGLMLSEGNDNLPRNLECVAMAGPFGNDCKQRLTGDLRGNVAPGILSLHALFVLEHNWWARKLAVANPSWNDEQLFQEARKRVVAELQVITYNEYLPMLLGEPLPMYKGYDANIDPRIDPAFAIAAYRYGHSGIIPLYFCIKADGRFCPHAPILLREAYFRPTYLEQGVTIGDLLRGQVVQPEGEIDTVLVSDVRNSVEGMMSDLAARDIMRGRDFGIPPFVEARKEAGLPAVTTWSDITDDARVQLALKRAYNNDITQVDLWVGGLAETASFTIAGARAFVGPTFAYYIREQFVRLRDGDRFWYANTQLTFNGKPYLDNATILELGKTRLADIIKRNTDWTGAPNSVFAAVDLTERR